MQLFSTPHFLASDVRTKVAYTGSPEGDFAMHVSAIMKLIDDRSSAASSPQLSTQNACELETKSFARG